MSSSDPERSTASRRHDGELGPLFGLRRSATARVVTRAAVTGYPVRDFRQMIAPDGIAHIVRTAAH